MIRLLILLFTTMALGSSCSHKSVHDRPRMISSSRDTCHALISGFQRKVFTPLEKARAINDRGGLIKGSFAEIGAGQEVAGTFFRAKRASETVVKSISAYGKEESNRLYGDGQRFVSKERLLAMLDVEYGNLRALKDQFSDDTRIFSFTNTVTTNKDGTGHGWIGLRLQTASDSGPVDILIHANFGKTAVLTQHKDIGKIGVNLIHAATAEGEFKSERIMVSLLDNIKAGNIDIDFVEFPGTNVSAAKSALELLHHGLSKNVMLNQSGASVPKDLFYKKAIFVNMNPENGLSEFDTLALRQVDEETFSSAIDELSEGVEQLWISSEANLLSRIRYLDQGMKLQVFYKLSVEELNELSDSQLKTFIRSLKSLRNSFQFKLNGSPKGLRVEALKLFKRLEENSLLIP